MMASCSFSGLHSWVAMRVPEFIPLMKTVSSASWPFLFVDVYGKCPSPDWPQKSHVHIIVTGGGGAKELLKTFLNARAPMIFFVKGKKGNEDRKGKQMGAL